MEQITCCKHKNSSAFSKPPNRCPNLSVWECMGPRGKQAFTGEGARAT